MKKIEREDGDIYTNFYAVTGPGFKRVDHEIDDLFGLTFVDRTDFYEGQLGFAQCKPGWINYVDVNDGKFDDDRQLQIGKPIDARRCGIASLLTSLCLMDPKINQLTADNQAIKYIKENKRMDDVETHCKNAFVGLHMVANPKQAAYGYLSAALKENYKLMIIQDRKTFKLGFTSSSKFYYYNTVDVRRNYDSQTGNVGSCECDAFGGTQQNQNCRGFGGYWYFCK